MDTPHKLCMYFTFFLPLLQVSVGRIGFVKDQSMTKIKFPPMLKKPHPGIPLGHLRPLGWHRAPDGPVKEISGMLSPVEFFEQYINQTKPVVFRGAISDVPAMTKWQKDEYLKKNYGHLQIHAMVKKELLQRGTKKITMKHFLREYNFEDWYLSNIIPQEMMHELILPDCLSCGYPEYLQESGIWMSSGGTVSLLHSHADHNLHCVMAGRKDFILIHPKHRHNAYFSPKMPHKGAGYAVINDMERLNMFQFPKLADVPWTWSTLGPGDCIFTPASYLHQVNSFGRSFSNTILWSPSVDIDFKKCTEQKRLDKVPFIWAYLHADRELANRKLDGEAMKHHLKVWMRDEKTLRFDIFKNYYKEIMSELPTKEVPDIKAAWKLVTNGSSTAKEILREDVENLPDDKLKQLAITLNIAHEYHGHEPEKSGAKIEDGKKKINKDGVITDKTSAQGVDGKNTKRDEL